MLYLLLNNGALVVKAFQYKLRDLFNNTDMRRSEKLANLLQFINRRDLVFVGRSPINYSRPPIGFDRSSTRIHDRKIEPKEKRIKA